MNIHNPADRHSPGCMHTRIILAAILLILLVTGPLVNYVVTRHTWPFNPSVNTIGRRQISISCGIWSGHAIVAVKTVGKKGIYRSVVFASLMGCQNTANVPFRECEMQGS